MPDLVERIIGHYLDSRDFNGLYFHKESPGDVAAAVELIEKGLVQAVDESDYMNPHIRPWPSRRSMEDQAESVKALADKEYGLCLYPTPEAMKGYDLGNRYKDEPYRRQMAEGRGTLELAYFRFDVLEPHNNLST